jgi:hypothetical protein
MGHRFVPPADATPAEPGEWLLLYNYGPDHDQRNGPTCGEWTCPAESDGYLRRMFWQVQP